MTFSVTEIGFPLLLPPLLLMTATHSNPQAAWIAFQEGRKEVAEIIASLLFAMRLHDRLKTSSPARPQSPQVAELKAAFLHMFVYLQ